MDELMPKRYSKTWKYFKPKGTNKDIATCKICKQDYCYKTISNLTSHLKKQHSNYYNKDTSDVDSNHSEEDSKTSLVNNETASHSTWQFFDIPDDSKFEAKCKICEQDISYDSVSDLTKHIREHDVMVSDDDDFEMDTEKLKIQSSSISRKRSPVWKYMEVINDKYAICMLCRKKLSYSSTISNLKKHLRSNHPHINFSEGEHKVPPSANGKVYEVQALRVETDPIEVNEYYIESDFDIEDDENKRATTPVRKILKKHREIKRNENVQEEINESRSRRTSSDSDKLTKRKSSQDCKKDTIDFFGSYVMSMLRELPKQVSDRLQSEIVNQIITAKIALDTQNNRLHKPVTMSNGTDINMPHITVNISDVPMADDITSEQRSVATKRAT